MAYFSQQLINDLTLGAIYGLIAVGYTLVYGIIGMINFAHGEIYMIGAFVSIICFTILGSAGCRRTVLLRARLGRGVRSGSAVCRVTSTAACHRTSGHTMQLGSLPAPETAVSRWKHLFCGRQA